MGWHGLWGTRMFDFGKYETLRFLLSNIRYWSEEFKSTGSDSTVPTAMLYHTGGFIGISSAATRSFTAITPTTTPAST